MTNNLWMSQPDWSTTGQINITKDSHVLIRRHWIPIYPGPRQIIWLRRENLNGQCIQASDMRSALDVQFMNAERAGYLIRGCNLLAVHPDVCTKVNAVEMQPDIPILITGRNAKLRPVPP